MAEITVLGAGLTGLATALLLARDGHRVTVLERDAALPAGTAEELWEHWERPGVTQFRQAHIMLARWRLLMEQELPEVVRELEGLGGVPISPVESMPASATGGPRADDAGLQGMAARRPVVEGALAAVALRTPGLTVRRGVTATDLVTDGRSGGVPHVAGVVTADGERIPAGLVVDAMGRRSPLAAMLARIGAGPAHEERDDCGFAYYGRHFRTTDGGRPRVATMLRHFASVSLLTLPADADVWAWVLVVSADDRPMRALRDAAAWERALALMPGVAGERAAAVPLTGIQVMSGLQDRWRNLVVDGAPVATGLVAVGDAWASTNPSLGRGSSMGLVHALVLRDVLRQVGPDAAATFVKCFDEATEAALGPLFAATRGYDRHRLAEVAHDIAGVPYRPGDDGWTWSNAFEAAAQADPDVLRVFRAMAELVAAPDALDGMEEKIARLGARAPRYPADGPSRAALLAAVGG